MALETVPNIKTIACKAISLGILDYSHCTHGGIPVKVQEAEILSGILGKGIAMGRVTPKQAAPVLAKCNATIRREKLRLNTIAKRELDDRLKDNTISATEYMGELQKLWRAKDQVLGR